MNQVVYGSLFWAGFSVCAVSIACQLRLSGRHTGREFIMANFGDSCRHHSVGRVAESGRVSHVLPALLEAIGNPKGLGGRMGILLVSSAWTSLVLVGRSLGQVTSFTSLTCIGGLDPASGTLWITDIAQHHIAVGVVFIVIGHLSKTDFVLVGLIDCDPCASM